jgi:serine/threonine protein kinase
VVVRSWSFEVLLRDTDVPEYGPHGADCEHNSVRADDANIFDKQFTCNCFGTGFKGDNCETAGEGTCAANEAVVDGACRPFQLVVNQEGIRTKASAEFTNPTTTTYFTVQEFASYRIAPLEINDKLTNYSAGFKSDLTYTMTGHCQTDGFYCDDAEDFFLNQQTGQMLGTFENFDGDKSATKTYTITLLAVDASGIKQELETMQIKVRYPDVEVDEYGPNKQECQNNGTRMDGLDGGGDPYDQSYVCKCISTSSTTYSGDNCEVATQPAFSSSGDEGAVAGGLITTFIVLLLVGYGAYTYRLKQLSMRAYDFDTRLAELMASGAIDVGDAEDDGKEGHTGPKVPREVKRSHVTMLVVVGAGQFGEVWKAVLDESATSGGVPGYTVAVKTSKEARGEGADEMTKEALVMAQVTGHPNIVALVGVVTSGIPLLLLLSYCEHGSLKSALMNGKCPGQANVRLATPASATIFQMALGIARGMVHLVAHRFVHRDLAARNVLLDGEFTCKVADFGLSRGVVASASGDGDEDNNTAEYYKSHGGAFPVRWTAPEAMENMKFSTVTDVWSYGVVLLEIVMGGAAPYPELKGNALVMNKIMSGYRTPKPAGCTDDLYAIMLECWTAAPEGRPSFTALVATLERMVREVELNPQPRPRDGKYDNLSRLALMAACKERGLLNQLSKGTRKNEVEMRTLLQDDDANPQNTTIHAHPRSTSDNNAPVETIAGSTADNIDSNTPTEPSARSAAAGSDNESAEQYMIPSVRAVPVEVLYDGIVDNVPVEVLYDGIVDNNVSVNDAAGSLLETSFAAASSTRVVVGAAGGGLVEAVGNSGVGSARVGEAGANAGTGAGAGVGAAPNTKQVAGDFTSFAI